MKGPHAEENTIQEVGRFQVEVFGAGRRNRYTSSKFQLRCDAIGTYANEILLLSVIGAETSVKTLTAGMRSSGQDQKRIEYSADLDDFRGRAMTRCDAGYRVYRTKLNYGLWHVLFLANRDGFMPVMTDDALWQHLQSDQFTTPLLREWVPWLKVAMQRRQSSPTFTKSAARRGSYSRKVRTLTKS